MEWLTTEDGKYRIESLSATTFQGALAVIKESFLKDENVSIAVGISKNEAAVEELLELCADAALDGVSLVAVHLETGYVAGVIFNKLQVASTDSNEKPFFEIFASERCTQAPSKVIVDLMVELDGRCNFFEKFGLDCSLEMMFLGTHREHRHRKLGFLLCKTSLELAKKLKDGPVAKITVKDLGPKYTFMHERKVISQVPKFCQAIVTVGTTQKICSALGFTTYLRAPFSKLYFNGKTYAEKLGTEEFCVVMALII